MSTTTDLLYTSLKADPAGEKLTVTGLARGPLDVMAAELLAAMIPVDTPAPVSGWAAILKYLSQWLPEANARRDDCGWACVAMFLRALGDLTPINGLASKNPTGLSDAAELQAMLKTHGVDSVIEYTSPSLSIAQALKPYTMILHNYTPFASLPDTWDKRFSGPDAWHWSIYVGPDPKNANNSLLMDPDYGPPNITGGDHRSVPTEALRSAFRPYGSSTTCTALYVPYGPIVLPPAPPTEQMIVNTDHLNIRPTPSTSRAPLRVINRGQSLVVRGAQKVGDYTWAEVISVDGLPQAGYVAREYLVPAPTSIDIPAPSTPPVVVPPVQQPTLTRLGIHFQTGGDKSGLLDLLHTGKIGGLLNMRVGRENDLTATEVKAIAGTTEVCERFYFPDIQSPAGRAFVPDWSQRDLRAVGYNWAREYFTTFKVDRKSNWHQIINEPGWGPGTASFWMGTQDYADEDKQIKLGLLCLSNGNPPLPDEQRTDYREFWTDPAVLEMLRRGKKRGDVMLLHQYALPQEQGKAWNDTWCILRHQRVYAVLPDDLKDMPLIIGEFGDTHGLAFGTEHYIANVKQALSLIQNDTYLRWFALWTWGAVNEAQWGADKIDGARAQLSAL